MTPTERRLHQTLRLFSDAGPQKAPDRVNRNLLIAFRSHHRRRRIARLTGIGGVSLAVAAGLAALSLWVPRASVKTPVLASKVYVRPVEQRKPAGEVPAVVAASSRRKYVPSRRKSLPASQDNAEFYVLPGADNAVPLEHATIVRVQLPLSAFRDVGLAVNEQTAANRVQADVLLGQDGLARAVRFVQ